MDSKMIEHKVYSNGTQCWYLNGKRHREDGPAIVFSDGSQFWYLNGKRHREDGPAIIYADGSQRWYLNGIQHHGIQYEPKNKFNINTNHNFKDGF